MAKQEGEKVQVRSPDLKVEDHDDIRTTSLVERLDLLGKKLFELRAVLYQESVVAGEQVDTLVLSTLASRFSKQIMVVDSIRISTSPSVTSLSSLTSKKERYHVYADQLKSYMMAMEGKSDLEKPFNSSVLSATSISSVNSSSSKIDANEMKVNSYVDNPNESIYEKVKAELILTEPEQNQDSFEPTLPETNSLSQVPALFSAVEEPLINLSNGKDVDDLINKRNLSPGPVSCKNHAALTIDLFEQSSSEYVLKEEEKFGETVNDLVPSPPEGSYSKNCKVMKKKAPGQKRHVQDVFPITPVSPPSPDLWRAETPLRNLLNKSATGLSFLCGGSDHSVSNGNISKSANESWFDVRNRCSSPSLQQIGSPFRLSDYLPETPSTANSRSKKKTVRFSVSPSCSPRARQLDPLSDLGDSTSEDDEVRFDVQQFPCVNIHSRKKRRNP